MSELQLFPGPRLVRKSWDYDDDIGAGEWISIDVTDRAHEYLFQDVEIDHEFTLADLFRLLIDKPIMQAVFRRNFDAELCAEVIKGPILAEEQAWERLEFLELYQSWSYDSSASTYEGADRFYLHGVGIVQDSDTFEHGYLTHKKGERIKWSISLTPVRELWHLPIRVNSEVLICEDDIDAKQYGKTLQTVKNKNITLGRFIQEILWELSWHGTPEDSEKVSRGLKEQMVEIDAGTAETVPYEDVFESFGSVSEKSVYAKFFVGTDTFDRAEVYQVLHELEDVELAQSGLKRLLDGKLQLRPEFAELTGRELRKAVREARHGKNDEAIVCNCKKGEAL